MWNLCIFDEFNEFNEFNELNGLSGFFVWMGWGSNQTYFELGLAVSMIM